MQRHKRPLEFLESPYEGGKRFLSPTLAARRPYLAPTISAEELNCKWVSPQFKQDDCETFEKPHKSRRNMVTKRKKKKGEQGEKQNKLVQKETTNLFPELAFDSSNKIESCSQQPTICKVNLPLRRSTRINQPNSIMPFSKQDKNIRDNKLFLFSLGSPKSPTVFGEILVHETPEIEVIGNGQKRLRHRDKRR